MGAPTQGREPRAKRGCIVPEHITASFLEEVRTYEEWATYPVDVLQLVCSQVGLAPAGSKHEMALRLVFFSNCCSAVGGPGLATAGGNDITWSPSGRHAALVASVPAVPLPVAHPVIPPFRFTQLGPAVEVPDEVIRPVNDLEVQRQRAPGFGFSLPGGASVDSGISREEFAVRYTSVDAAMAIVRSLGRTAFMVKADIHHAFCFCPVQPAAWPLLCYTWGERVYVELRLPFGALSSPFIFTQFGQVLHWIAVHVRGCSHVLHSRDDYFLAWASHAVCSCDLQAFQDLCLDLGVPLRSEKLVLPTRCLQFLGITLDSSLQEMRLPPDKLAAVADWSAFLRMQGGPSGPHFPLVAYRFIYDGPGLGAPHQPHRGGPRGHRVVGGIPAQLERAGFLPVAAAALGFATDASGVGLGTVFSLKWLYVVRPFHAYHTNVLVLFAVAVAVHCWGE